MELYDMETMEVRLWNVAEHWRPERTTEIIAALKDLDLPDDFSLVDVACGKGEVIVAIKEAFPQSRVLGIDIESFPEWHLHFDQMSVQDLIKTDTYWNVVMMLNSYRNWEGPDKEAFDTWVEQHAKHFIFSTRRKIYAANERLIGEDTHDIPLVIKHI